jgi:hypothetical protein
MFKEITNEDLAKMFNIPLEDVWTVESLANSAVNEKEYTWYKLCVFYHAITEIYDRELTDLRSPYDPTEAFVGGQERHLSNAYAKLTRRFVYKVADRLGMSSRRKLSDFDYYRFSAQGWIIEYNRLKENGEMDFIYEFFEENI